MKKYLLSSIFIFFMSAHSLGQDIKEPKLKIKKWTCGINTSLITSSLFKIENDKIFNPYILDVRRRLRKLSFVTIGIGGHNENKINQLEGFADKTFIDDWKLALRLGYGRQEVLNAKWEVDYGLHIVTEMFANNIIQDSGFDKISDINQGFNFGGGPFLSVSYNILEKLSLRSESALYYHRGVTYTAKTFQSVPESSDFGTRTITNTIKTFVPINIYLTYHF